MRDKKSGTLTRVQKIKKRLSHSFGRLCKLLFFFLMTILNYGSLKTKVFYLIFFYLNHQIDILSQLELYY